MDKRVIEELLCCFQVVSTRIQNQKRNGHQRLAARKVEKVARVVRQIAAMTVTIRVRPSLAFNLLVCGEQVIIEKMSL